MFNKHDINIFLTYINSQETAQQFLFQCYTKMDNINEHVKSYENCHSFLAYLEHGNQFYQNGKVANIILKPVLLFYGMTHLLKATLLTIRPNYPESTKVLAHGASTRKRKKKNYSFMEDEIKVQQDGLFLYVAKHLFQIDILPSTKYKMGFLLSLIPEISSLFQLDQQSKWCKVGVINEDLLVFPDELFDQYHLTEKAFISRIKSHLPEIKKVYRKQNLLYIQLIHPIKSSTGPFFLNLNEQEVYFPNNRDYFSPISEVMIHYLILYNLSMICRYETEWWADLLRTRPDKDYPFISYFLKITADKIPILLGNMLRQLKTTNLN